MLSVKRDWRALLGILLSAFGLLLSIYQLYRAWAFHAVLVPARRFGDLSYGDSPLWFACAAAAWAFLAVVACGFIWLLSSEWRAEARFFRRRDTRPPFDDAIRDPADRDR